MALQVCPHLLPGPGISPRAPPWPCLESNSTLSHLMFLCREIRRKGKREKGRRTNPKKNKTSGLLSKENARGNLFSWEKLNHQRENKSKNGFHLGYDLVGFSGVRLWSFFIHANIWRTYMEKKKKKGKYRRNIALCQRKNVEIICFLWLKTKEKKGDTKL